MNRSSLARFIQKGFRIRTKFDSDQRRALSLAVDRLCDDRADRDAFESKGQTDFIGDRTRSHGGHRTPAPLGGDSIGVRRSLVATGRVSLESFANIDSRSESTIVNSGECATHVLADNASATTVRRLTAPVSSAIAAIAIEGSRTFEVLRGALVTQTGRPFPLDTTCAKFGLWRFGDRQTG